jgi:hypothetical protein
MFSNLKDLRGGGGGSFFLGTDAKPRFEGFGLTPTFKRHAKITLS